MHSEDPATQQLRYARQIALPDWGEAGQRRLDASRVMVVGLGGLGAPAVTYLAGAGVGRLTLNDFDSVDLSNLPRQPLHATGDVGRTKTASARDSVARLNPNVETRLLDTRLDAAGLAAAVAEHNAVVDCSDNLTTRLAVSAACRRAQVALVSVAAIRHEGQLALFPNNDPQLPCYACYASPSDENLEDCAGQGVFTPLVGVMGSLAALETLKWLLDPAPRPAVELHCFDGKSSSWRALRIRRNPRCEVCSSLT